jgi:hypothetical protein
LTKRLVAAAGYFLNAHPDDASICLSPYSGAVNLAQPPGRFRHAGPQYTLHCSPESDERKAYVQEIAQEILRTRNREEGRSQNGESPNRETSQGSRENLARDRRSIAERGIEIVKIVCTRSGPCLETDSDIQIGNGEYPGRSLSPHRRG